MKEVFTIQKTIIIILLTILQVTHLFAKSNDDIDSLFDKIMSSEGLRKTQLIDKLSDYPIKKVVSKTKKYLSSSDIENKETAAEISGIIKSKSYEKTIKKELKKAKDFQLINSLIFSIGENRYHKLGNSICKYINDKKHVKTAYFALIKLNDNSCFKKFNKILKKGTPEKQLPILEFIIKTKNKKYLKSLKKLFKKSKNSSVKYSSSIALLTLNDKSSTSYMINYLNKELDSDYLTLNAYKSLEKLLDKDNVNTDIIFLNGIKSKYENVKLFSIMVMSKNNKYDKLSEEDVDFIESFSKTQSPQKYVYYAEYKRFLKIYKREENERAKKAINKNEDAKPE